MGGGVNAGRRVNPVGKTFGLQVKKRKNEGHGGADGWSQIDGLSGAAFFKAGFELLMGNDDAGLSAQSLFELFFAGNKAEGLGLSTVRFNRSLSLGPVTAVEDLEVL